ncbi:MAG: major facilitator transporter [Naasia sp.]|nr:major facilitator transporter [Naasia sp.]
MISRRVAFVGFSLSLVAVYLSSGAPTPLLVVWQQEFGFPDSLLTLAFASYAFSFLVALLVGGSLSDHLGRKPVILASLTVGAVSMLLFVGAPGVDWIVVARTLQGLATGVVTAAYTAALVELGKPGSRTGPVIAAAAPVFGLGVGALVGGIAVELWGVDADVPLFAAFTVLMVLAIVVAFIAPETTTRVPGALASLIPNVRVPRPARPFFFGVLPVLVAAWMAGSVFLGLSPTIIQEILGIRSGFLNGFTASIHALTVAIGSVAFGRLRVRFALRVGGAGVTVGVGLIVVGVWLHALPVVWVGGVVEGLAFGAAFGAIFRGLEPLAPEHERAATFAAVYVAAYLALGVPAVIAGQLIEMLGLLPVILGWTSFIVLLAAVGFVVQSRQAATER